MPVVVACLVPAAPLLLPRLTGDRVPETAAVRAAVAQATARLAGTDRLVVVAPRVDGHLDGFGGRGRPHGVPPEAGDPGAATPGAAAAAASWLPSVSWPHALAEELLAEVTGAPTDRTWCTWPGSDGCPEPTTRGSRPGPVSDLGAHPDLDPGADPDTVLDAVLDAVLGAPGRTGLLLLADGSRTRGARAPGGDDPRGAAVDAELAAALREQRRAHVPDAAAVGAATAVPAVALLARLASHGTPAGPTEVLLDEAPLGVGYLVAVLGGPPAGGAAALVGRSRA